MLEKKLEKSLEHEKSTVHLYLNMFEILRYSQTEEEMDICTALVTWLIHELFVPDYNIENCMI